MKTDLKTAGKILVELEKMIETVKGRISDSILQDNPNPLAKVNWSAVKNIGRYGRHAWYPGVETTKIELPDRIGEIFDV